MSAVEARLPADIRRPLLRAALGIIGFLGLFALWAGLAPLATTVTLNGSIVSSRPAFALQHPYGGLVQEVLVERHDAVAQGQLLMRLDVSTEAETLTLQQAMHTRITEENRTIEALLGGIENAPGLPDSLRASPHVVRREQVRLQSANSRETAESLRHQADALRSKVALARAQLALMSERAERQGALRRQGLLARNEQEAQEEQIFIVKGEIEADLASVYNLESQIGQTLRQAELAELSFEQELRATREQNLARLDELQASIIALRDRIAQSEVRAPIAGKVTEVPLEAERMFAARGATLLTLAQPLEQAQIAFSVPVDHIDQVHPGMGARLTIPSLPQRQLPQIDLTISAISLRASVDEAGNPTAYGGLAEIDTAVLDDLRTRLGGDALSEDMPVMLTVSVRETTFADYLLTPLVSAFGRALQD